MVLNSWGDVYRLTAQTTGDTRAEIDRYLATVDRAELLTVTETRAVLREAAAVQWAEQQLAARPATATETKIIEALRLASSHDRQLASVLKDSGLTLARVSEADLAAFKRENAEKQLGHQFHVAAGLTTQGSYLDKETGETVYPRYSSPELMPPAPRPEAKVEIGEIVAVNQWGGMHRLNPYQVSQQRLLAELSGTPVKDVTSTRAVYQEEREAREAAFERRLAERNERAALSREAKAGAQAVRQVNQTISAATKPLEAAAGAVAKVADAAATVAENVLGMLFGETPAAPPPAKDQSKAEADPWALAQAARDASRRPSPAAGDSQTGLWTQRAARLAEEQAEQQRLAEEQERQRRRTQSRR